MQLAQPGHVGAALHAGARVIGSAWDALLDDGRLLPALLIGATVCLAFGLRAWGCL